jgi:hypothetical protein
MSKKSYVISEINKQNDIELYCHAHNQRWRKGKGPEGRINGAGQGRKGSEEGGKDLV